jgi:hypothetical protein
MKAAHDRVNLFNASGLLDLPHRVDDARMTA